jgi:hypothetical protein
VLAENSPRLQVTSTSGGNKPRLTAVYIEDVSPPPHRVGDDETTRYRFTCTHSRGRPRRVTVTLDRLQQLYADAANRPTRDVLL